MGWTVNSGGSGREPTTGFPDDGRMDSDDLASEILSSLSALPPEEQAEVILSLISASLKNMTIYRILEVRDEIVTELDSSLEIVQMALDLIDGQMALREISGPAGWR